MAEEQEDDKDGNNEGTEDSLETEEHGSGYHVADQDVDYYEVKGYNQEAEEPEVNFVTASMVQCRDCHQAFDSRNALLRHLRSGTAKTAHYPKGCPKRKSPKPTAMVATPMSEKLPKIVSASAAAKDIGTGYGFRN